jgi:hypothetical protein
MFKKFLCVTLIALPAIYIYAQPPCCSGGGAANVSLGGNSGSMLMPRSALGIQVSNMFWYLKSQEDTYPWLTPVADVHYVSSTVFGLHYGLVNNLSMSVSAPYIVIRSDVYSENENEAVESNSGSSRGFGDMTAMFRIQLPIKNARLPKIALIAGMEMPTGFTDANNGAVVASMGSKTWDPIFGIGLQKKTKSERWNYALNSTYKISPENRDSLDFGDFWNASFQLTYSFQSKLLRDGGLKENGVDAESKWFKSISAGITNDFLFKQKYNGLVVFNTGFNRLYGTLGGSIGIKKRLTMSVFGDIPLLESVRGQQNKSAFRLRASLLISLNTK